LDKRYIFQKKQACHKFITNPSNLSKEESNILLNSIYPEIYSKDDFYRSVISLKNTGICMGMCKTEAYNSLKLDIVSDVLHSERAIIIEKKIPNFNSYKILISLFNSRSET
jgi:hypothetical protein